MLLRPSPVATVATHRLPVPRNPAILRRPLLMDMERRPSPMAPLLADTPLPLVLLVDMVLLLLPTTATTTITTSTTSTTSTITITRPPMARPHPLEGIAAFSISACPCLHRRRTCPPRRRLATILL